MIFVGNWAVQDQVGEIMLNNDSKNTIIYNILFNMYNTLQNMTMHLIMYFSTKRNFAELKKFKYVM